MDPTQYKKVEFLYRTENDLHPLDVYWINKNDCNELRLLSNILRTVCDIMPFGRYEYYIRIYGKYRETAAFYTYNDYLDAKEMLDIACKRTPNYIMTDLDYNMKKHAQEIAPPDRESRSFDDFLDSIPPPDKSRLIPTLSRPQHYQAGQLQGLGPNPYWESQRVSSHTLGKRSAPGDDSHKMGWP